MQFSECNKVHLTTQSGTANKVQFMSVEKKEPHNWLSNYLRIYFNFSYYLCTSPFCVKEDQNGSFHVRTWKPQQLICALMHITCIFRMIASVRSTLPGPEDKSYFNQNPIPYFKMMLSIASFVYKVVTLKRFWLNSAANVALLNRISRDSNLPKKRMKIQNPYFIGFLYGVFVLQAIGAVIAGYGFVSSITEWTPSWWLRRLVALARYVFFFSDQLGKDAPRFSDMSIGDGVIAVATLLATIERFICDLWILAAATTLWMVAYALSKDITLNDDKSELEYRWEPDASESAQEWSSIYKKYQSIRKLSACINNSLGSVVTWFMVEGILYYSTNLNDVVIANDLYRRVDYLIFYLLTAWILYIAADICNQLECVKAWIVKEDNLRSIPVGEMCLVLHEIERNDIGIRGSGMFTLTFSLVGAFISLIVTFFIICVQYSRNED